MIEWLNENENRPYPVQDSTYLKDDNGQEFPFSFIADIGVSVPEGTDKLFITGFYSGPAIISVAIGTASEGLLVFTGSKTNVASYKPVYLSPVNDGVSGYIIFGNGINHLEGSYKFTQGQMQLDFKTVRSFHGAEVVSVNKLGAADASKLSGIVNLAVAGAMTIRKIDEHTIAFGLEEGTEADFLGPCDKVAEFNKCGPPPIRSINGAVPDANGIIIVRTK